MDDPGWKKKNSSKTLLSIMITIVYLSKLSDSSSSASALSGASLKFVVFFVMHILKMKQNIIWQTQTQMQSKMFS